MERETMDEDTVSSVMTASFVSINRTAPLTDAAKTMCDAEVGSLLIVDADNRPEGILTRSDFVAFVADESNLAADAVPPAASVMTTGIATVSPDTPLTEARDLMREEAVHHLPVVSEGGRVVGVVTTSDLADTAESGVGISG
jgi:CBS domain-containing protein